MRDKLVNNEMRDGMRCEMSNIGKENKSLIL